MKNVNIVQDSSELSNGSNDSLKAFFNFVDSPDAAVPEELTVDEVHEELTDTAIPNAYNPVKWEDIAMPDGYDVNNSGLYKIKWNSDTEENDRIRICSTPVAISSLGQDIDSGDVWYEVIFEDSLGQIIREKATQEDLTRKSKLWKFSKKGLNITDKKVGQICEYFSKSIEKCSRSLPNKKSAQSNGWKNGQQSFVLGTRMYTNSGITEVVQLSFVDQHKEIKGLGKKGNLKEWVNGVRDVISEPITRFKCYCMGTSILLKPLDAQSFLVDHAGETSTGKTFGFKVAVSIYGDPKEMILAGNSTPSFLDEIANVYTDMPLFLDETSMQDPEILTKIIYMLANEVGKGRANKDGGVRVVNRWKLVTFATGEKPITDSDGFGGQQVRVIEIQKRMPYMHDQIVRAEDAINNNYGHVIDLYFKKVFENQGELKPKYEAYRKEFINSDSSTANRAASTFAAIALAGELLEKVFSDIGLETQDNLELTRSFFNETVKDNPVEPYALKALRFLNDFIEQNRNNFVIFDEDQIRRPFRICGYMKDNYIDIIPSVANDALKGHKFDFSSVRNQWIEWGVLITNKNRNDYKPAYKDENDIRPTVYRIDSMKMQEILENGI